MNELSIGPENLTETDAELEELANLSSDNELDNDELVPTDDEDVEDIDAPANNNAKEPELKPISATNLAAMLLHIKSQKIGFKFGEVYFEIADVDPRKGTFTAKPANQVVGTFKPPPKPNQKIGQKAKKARRKKGRK